MCSVYIYDILRVPIRFDEILYEYVKQKRLARILPEFTGIFMKLFGGMEDIHYSIANFMCMSDTNVLDKDEDEIQILKWKSMAKWFRLVNNDYGLIEILLQEHCVCDNEYISEVIGYFLERLFCVRSVHKEHSNPLQIQGNISVYTDSVVVEGDTVLEGSIIDEALRIVEEHDELYD